MMNPELKAKWIADLKTHKQVTGQLCGWRDIDDGADAERGYCCLGVACLTLAGVFEYESGYDLIPRLNGRALNDGEGLNRYALDLLGINEKTQSILIVINDQSDTFEPVIAYIEANL